MLDKVRAPSTVSLTYRALQQFMKYLCQEDEELRNPMEHLQPPIVPEKTVPVLGDDDLAALLAPGHARASQRCATRPQPVAAHDRRQAW